MDLERSDDQELFRETTRKFLESTAPVSTVRQWSEKEAAGYPVDWWRRGAELGWTSLLVGEADGGGSVSGNGLADLALVAEEMGRLVSPGPLLMTNVVAAALSEAGTAEQRAAVLPGLVGGETVATWCLAEPGRPACGGEAVALEAARQGDRFVLSGVKGPVEAAAEAGHLLVTALVDGRPTQFVVPASTPGVTVVPLQGIDLARRIADVHLDGVTLGPEHLLGEVGGAAAQVERQLQVVVALQCAMMAGAVDEMFTRTVEYAFDRYSFGRALASYQALKHRFADMKLWLEAIHATTTGAVRSVGAREERAAELVSVAKSYVGTNATVILQDCVQLHGGIGVTWDHDLHLYLRRVVQERSLFGTPEEHRERIAAGMGL